MAALPAGYAARAATLADRDAWLAVIFVVDEDEMGYAEYSMDDVDGDFGRPGFDLASDAFVVTDPTGTLVGHGNVACRVEDPDLADLDVYVHPAHPTAELEAYLLERTEARARELGAARARIANIPGNTVRDSLFRASGYELVRCFHRMRIDFDGPLTAPVVPEGVTLRNFVPGVDDAATIATVDAAFGEHWDSQPTHESDWQNRFVGRSDFDPSLWWLAEVDGEIAGVLIGFPNQAGAGWVKELGVRKEYRGRGIARTLLLTSFAAFQSRGWGAALLGVDTENATGALRLYEGAGMSPAFRIDVFERRLS